MGQAADHLQIPIAKLIRATILAAYVNLNAGVSKPMWEVTLGEWSLFGKRIFSQNRASNLFLWVFFALQIGYIIAFSIVPGFICNPIDRIGNSFEALVYCDYDYFYATRTSVYVVSMVFDVVLAIFPLVVVYQLKLAAKKRLSAANLADLERSQGLNI
ncbi:hypothetical protein B0I35DRAFT_413042 [Stachybotrys elegans]|uniref:Rhodopsin domain-containing protein n=1 Tax=Stachybotrys elegans TaxID=80388 RepID=A0A8K0SLY4_9HYPO|nr:hypothetical protein B0I35DRAFT_413042 [Stachybotrys elegans]